MKVFLATQTISSSVADAINYLRTTGCKQFHGSEATCEFLTFDRLFDMLNCRSVYGKGYKAPLSLQNQRVWDEVLKTSEKYIYHLKLEGQSILNIKRKTFALGFLININSFRQLALDLLQNINKSLKFFLPYKCSQDHIELYFSCLRSRGGWNNNPNILQVLWAVRRFLYKNSVKASINANCLIDDFEASPILEFRSKKRTLKDNVINDINDKEIQNLISKLENIKLSFYQKNILYYITGNIIQKFLQKNTCLHCHDIVLMPYSSNDHGYTFNINLMV